MLIDKNMKRIEMQSLTGISGNILARMEKKTICINGNDWENLQEAGLHHGWDDGIYW